MQKTHTITKTKMNEKKSKIEKFSWHNYDLLTKKLLFNKKSSHYITEMVYLFFTMEAMNLN